MSKEEPSYFNIFTSKFFTEMVLAYWRMKLTMESRIEALFPHEAYYITYLQTTVLVLPLPATETPPASFYSDSPFILVSRSKFP